MYKEILSAVAIVLTFAIFVPYVCSIYRGQTKPHVFSWVVWGLGTLIIFFAQIADEGGVGAWAIGVSACITLYIALLAYLKRADTNITQADWAFFLAAISALPLWFFTSDPVWTVIVLTIADLVGFGPTYRKSYTQPHEESVFFFSLGSVRNLLVVLALEHYSVTTVLFPAAVGLACIFLAVFLLYRRQVLSGVTRISEERRLNDA